MTTQDKTKTPTDDGGPLYPATEPERERVHVPPLKSKKIPGCIADCKCCDSDNDMTGDYFNP
jgi:hypothetical protein